MTGTIPLQRRELWKSYGYHEIFALLCLCLAYLWLAVVATTDGAQANGWDVDTTVHDGVRRHHLWIFSIALSPQ